MRICVFGAGAVGGHLAGRLASTGQCDLSVIARGDTLAAIRSHGLRVKTRSEQLISHPTVTDRPSDLGPQDVVLVAVKAPDLPAIAPDLGTLLHPDSRVLLIVNGIPWWYFYGHGGPHEGAHLRQLDPGHALLDTVGSERTVGVVAYTPAGVVEPGLIRTENVRNGLVIGRPDGRADHALSAVAPILEAGDLQVRLTSHIRDDVWAKLVLNLIAGALGLLTASAMIDAMRHTPIAATASAMAHELFAVAREFGYHPGDPDELVAKLAESNRLQGIAQDLLTGLTMEVDAIFTVPLVLARRAHVATPISDMVIELAVQRARAAGLYPGTR